MMQLDLFGETLRAEKFSRIYQAMGHRREKYGKHTVFLGSSFLVHKFGQHLGVPRDEPLRKQQLLKGETKRKRLGMPMFMGKLMDDLNINSSSVSNAVDHFLRDTHCDKSFIVRMDFNHASLLLG